MKRVKKAAILSLGLLVSLPSYGDDADQPKLNPVLEEILEHDVIFVGEFENEGGNGRFVIKEQLKGEITKSVMAHFKNHHRLGDKARIGIKGGDKFLFMFWKNGTRLNSMHRLSWTKRICRWEGRRYWCVSIEDIKQAVKE